MAKKDLKEKSEVLSIRLTEEGYDVIGELLAYDKQLKGLIRRSSNPTLKRGFMRMRQDILFKLLDMSTARPKSKELRSKSDRVTFNISLNQDGKGDKQPPVSINATESKS